METVDQERAEMRANSNPGGPLDGYVVVDMGQAAVGPIAAMYLGMMGATVIKVEPPRGDFVRAGAPTMRGTSTTFIGNNWTKLGAALDAKDSHDNKLLRELLSHADVLIENFRSEEVLARLGLGYETLREINPRLVYLQSSAFGGGTPWEGMASNEWITEALGGFASVTGAEGTDVEFCRGISVLDWNGAMVNAVGALAGLLKQVQSGTGTMARTSQLTSTIFGAVTRAADILAGRHARPLGSRRAGVAPDRAFATSDGYVCVGAYTETQWKSLCSALGLADLGERKELKSPIERFQRADEFEERMADAFRNENTRTWVEWLRNHGIPCTAVLRDKRFTDALLEDEQVRVNSYLEVRESPWGTVRTAGPHWRFDKTPARIDSPSPELGEHTSIVVDKYCRQEKTEKTPETTHAENVSGSRSDAESAGILNGVNVVEATQGLSGAIAGMILADLGASVTKVEPEEGDWLRGAFSRVDGEAVVFNALNRHKHIIKAPAAGMDWRSTEIEKADVVLVGAPELSSQHWHIQPPEHTAARQICCVITGWGPNGPLKDEGATELGVQVAAGMTRHLGTSSDKPVRMGYDVVSVGCGLSAVQGVLASFIWKAASDKGQRIDVSMLGVGIALNQWALTGESEVDAPLGPQVLGEGWAPDHGFAAADGYCRIDFGYDENKWKGFLRQIGRSEVLESEPFLSGGLRANLLLLPRYLNETLANWSLSSLEKLVRGNLQGTFAPVLNVGELRDSGALSNAESIIGGVGESLLPIVFTDSVFAEGRARESLNR